MDNLQTRACKCGYEFQTSDIKPPLNRVTKGFYGGNVDRTSDTACPECSRKYSLWIKQTGQTWRVVTVASKDPVESADAVDEFDYMKKPELQAWLTSQNITYHSQLGEKKLRDLCRKHAKEIESAPVVEVELSVETPVAEPNVEVTTGAEPTIAEPIGGDSDPDDELKIGGTE